MDSRNELVDEIFFDCKPSYGLLLVVGLMFLGAGWIVVSLDMTLWLKILLTVLLFVYVVHVIGQDILLCTNRSVVRLSYFAPKGQWKLFLRNHQDMPGVLRADSIVTRYIVILRFKCESRRCLSVCLLPSSLPPGSFRSLQRVLFLHKKLSASQEGL